jgi:hypothetical protein
LIRGIFQFRESAQELMMILQSQPFADRAEPLAHGIPADAQLTGESAARAGF